jgi:Cof subfamily protein (haloacid dehalogenase superfamily)
VIELLLSDVDGTLVRTDKSLSERSITAVRRLRDEGILFAITSGRPPRGMAMLVEPLELTTPVAAFNGGLMVEPRAPHEVLEERVVPRAVVGRAIELLDAFELDVWVYRDADWLVLDPDRPHVRREADTVQFEPILVKSFGEVETGVVKIVGVSDDHDAVERASVAAQDELGDRVSAARSQPYYLDITHPKANKGAVVAFLSGRLDIPEDRIATIGDMPNDVLMFAHSGLSIAMGNADREVQRAARRVTTSNDDDGFAHAVERYILGRADA